LKRFFAVELRISFPQPAQGNQQIVTWLGYQASSPQPSTATQEKENDPESKSTDSGRSGLPKGMGIFLAKDRLKATMPDQPVELAQPLEIPLNLTNDDVVSITVTQNNTVSSFENKSGGSLIGSGDAAILQDDGLTKTIEITPLQVGELNVQIHVLFADGGLTTQTYKLDVVPSSKHLKKFNLNKGFPTLAIVLGDTNEERTVALSPEVYYDHLDYPIYLTDSKQITFTVEQPDGNPVVRLDSSGVVHGLRPGKVKISGRFDGVQDSVVVDVYTKEEAADHIPQKISAR
jgi:hypothetical protein